MATQTNNLSLTPGATPDSDAIADEADAILSAENRRPVGGPFYALSFRDFRLFFVGQFISVIGTWMQQVAQQWLVYDLTHSAKWLGIISGASAIPYVIFAISGGQVADRYSRRTTLLVTQTAAMILAIILAVLATNRWIPIQAWHLAALAALAGVVNAYNMPAQQAFVVDIVEDRTALGNAIALNSLRFNLARFLGPVIAGAVLVKAGAAACFAVNAVSFIAVIISLAMTKSHHSAQRPGRDMAVGEGLHYILKARTILRVVLLLGVGSLFAWSIPTIFPLLSANFGKGAGGYSAMMGAQGLGAALGGLFMATYANRFPRRLLVYGGIVVQSLALVLVGLSPWYWGVLIGLAVAGFTLIMFAIAANTRVQEDAPDALRGRVMAVYSLVQSALMPLGGLAVGFAAGHWGVSSAITVFALLCLVGVLGIWAWSNTDRTSRVAIPQ